MLSISNQELQQRCEKLLPKLQDALGDTAELNLCEASATVGGGALPLAELPGWVICLVSKNISLNEMTNRLRRCDPPVVGRIQDDRFLIDPRTLSDDDEESLLQALRQVLV
jgi:L-seryl-tRNA(Ser) seleniumtransferase